LEELLEVLSFRAMKLQGWTTAGGKGQI